MPKIKTHKATAKRLTRTAKGKFKRYRAYATHLLTGKSAKRRRRLRCGTLVHSTNVKRIQRLIPY